MTVETELKLRIAPEHMARLKRHALLKTLQLARPVTQRVYSIYYDTPKLKLQQAGMALRLRRVGRQWVQTLKGGGGVRGGLHQRNEWEMPVSGAVLAPDLLQYTDYIEYFNKSMAQKIRPVFVTDFTRNRRMLAYQGAQIELSIDQGEISTEHKKIPLCELELELKSGDPKVLFDLALAIHEIVPCELEAISKAEQGYRLFGGYTAQPQKALPVELKKNQPLSTALQTLLWSVIQQVQGNLPGTMQTQNVEYLHQLRIALRRLRVLLRMLERVQADAQLAAFRQEFSALCSALGRVRNWDVFIANIVLPLSERMLQDTGLRTLLEDSRGQRAACFNGLMQHASMQSWQKLLLQFGSWMLGAYWQQFAQDELALRDFASRHLMELADQLAQQDADASNLHTLRIQAKKLRYSAEFFASLYGKHKSAAYLAALSALQEVLGQINDAAVGGRLLDELALAASADPQAIAQGRGWLAHESAQQLQKLCGVLQNFQQSKRYW